ncbi:MAG TPA: coproporphyrinogen dehydrogenase HemZ [Caproiciproducens sp.]|nr:coproporphyrinogen dehydrogenase HemZ [Caproiciproducens sp.]
MTLIIDGHSFQYEMENLCRIFYPYQKIIVTQKIVDDKIAVYTGMRVQAGKTVLCARLKTEAYYREYSDTLSFDDAANEKEQERRMAILLFRLLCECCGYTPKWGILTGVRPVKLLRMLTQKMGEKEALEYFKSAYLVSDEKTGLCRETMLNEGKILKRSRPESFSLYISIPFCPSRCSYCSFISSSVEQTAKLIPSYLELLCKEIEHTGKIAAELGLRLESAYIGGGTPTTLSAEQLELLLKTVNACFDFSYCKEFTVEAGRPDTITQEKLVSLKNGGTSRISINPQTLNDRVLKTIGRRHTTQQTLSAFSLARKLDFQNINMDLIAGLPDDTEESFQSTLDQVIDLAPESITVHTLALKRSARMYQDENKPFNHDAEAVGRMLDYSDRLLLQSGYVPYYLYRQSRMVGNLENTGWAKPGFESPYNVYIMDETHTILACGAGASSKVKDPGSDRLERIFNFKYPYEYINRFEEMITRKDQVKAIYGEFCRI